MAKKFKKNLNKTKDHNDIRLLYLEKISKFCDKCGSPYSVDDLQIIKKSKSQTIIHFSCHFCKASKIVQISNVHQADIIQQVYDTDLQNQELLSFIAKRPVSLNDVIDVYSYLKKRKGKIKV
jgi:glycerol dehydrogenase-like iron-containing ADH family enzyme